MTHPRRDYSRSELRSTDLAEDPLDQFRAWFAEAEGDAHIDEPYAMNVATVDSAGFPHARIVLLREVTDDGFVFFTNYDSDKGHHIDTRPDVALTFYWGPLERQIRVQGQATKVSAEVSDEYFASRPHKSKLGALVSSQSAVIPSRAELEEQMTTLNEQYPEGSTVPRPPHWGGYVVTPSSMEFWQGRRNRLHDRLRYRRESGWVLERLAP